MLRKYRVSYTHKGRRIVCKFFSMFGAVSHASAVQNQMADIKVEIWKAVR